MTYSRKDSRKGKEGAREQKTDARNSFSYLDKRHTPEIQSVGFST
jgi:hypothetical protein